MEGNFDKMPPVPDAQVFTPKDKLTEDLETSGVAIVEVDYTNDQMRVDNFLRDISEDTVVPKSDGQTDMVCYYQYATTTEGYLDPKHLYQHVALERPTDISARDKLVWNQVKPAATFVKDTIAHYKKVDADSLKPSSIETAEDGIQLQISAGGQAMTVTIGQNTLRIGGKSFPMPDRNILHQNPIEIRAFIKDAVVNYREAALTATPNEEDTDTLKHAYPELALRRHWYKGEIVEHRAARLTALSVRGFAHYFNEQRDLRESDGTPRPIERQDASAVFSGENTVGVCVADGHGSDSCPYSADGAQAATEVFKEVGQKFDSTEWRADTPNIADTIRQHIITNWRQRIFEIHQDQGRADFNVQQYGTTLAGTFRLTTGELLVINIGDGEIFASKDQPNGRDPKLYPLAHEDTIANETASLCSLCPREISVSIYNAAISADWDMVHLVTDGLYNTFESDPAFYKLFSDIHEGRGFISDAATMAKWMADLSAKGGGGDDVSYASLEFDKPR